MRAHIVDSPSLILIYLILSTQLQVSHALHSRSDHFYPYYTNLSLQYMLQHLRLLFTRHLGQQSHLETQSRLWYATELYSISNALGSVISSAC